MRMWNSALAHSVSRTTKVHLYTLSHWLLGTVKWVLLPILFRQISFSSEPDVELAAAFFGVSQSLALLL